MELKEGKNKKIKNMVDQIKRLIELSDKEFEKMANMLEQSGDAEVADVLFQFRKEI